MRIRSTALALLFPILPVAFAANPEDLYTREGTDFTIAELLDSGLIVPGESWSTSTVRGSRIVVNHELLEQQTGVIGAFTAISGVHIPISGRRTDYANVTRWYQQDGNTQVFRLFQGEHNYRYDILEEAPPSRVEAVSPTLAVAAGTWREWEGTYTIIHPLSSTIFQLFHEGSDLWSFHLGMSGSGDISFDRRRDEPDLPSQITLATNMVGKSLSIKVRANGFNYELYRKIPLVDEDWKLVTIGSYQQSPTNKVIFRWGMYPGSQPGSTSRDGMLFVSGATTRTSTAPPAPPPAPPATYYWDNNGSDAGFGTAAGTWAAPTIGSATQGWSSDSTGATLPVDVTTATYDPVNFGNGATGLAAGVTAVSGTVSAGSMTFASGSGKITLSGGTITLPDDAVIDVNNNISGGNAITTALAGAVTKLTVTGRYTLTLNGASTYTGQTIFGDNTNTLTVRINSIADVGGGASSLGAPTTVGKGLIQIGATSRSSVLEFIGASAAASTDRKVQVGSVGNGSGSAQILNNDSDPTHTLTFSNAAFNVAAIGPYSSTNRYLTLGGSNAGDNTIAGAIIDNGVSGVGLTKSGTGTWVLAGACGYTNATTIGAGILKMGADNVLPSGTGTGSVSVNGGANTSSRGTLDLNGFNLAINGLGGTTGTARGRVVNNATATDRTLTVGNNNASGTFNGIIADNTAGTGTLALTKVGTGTQTLVGPNSYTGATTISGGTLALGASNVLADATAVSLGAATLKCGTTFTDTAGTLEVTDSATINLGDGDSKLAFAGSIAVTWTGTLNITGNFVSGASLRFGDGSGSGLTPSQLAGISAAGFTSFALDGSGYLTASVSPGFSGWMTGIFANGAVAGARRGPNDDYDNDGISNLVEYAIADQDPTVPNASVGTFDGSTLSFTKRAGASGLTYAIQESSDLGVSDDWTEVSGGSYVNATTTITYTLPGGPATDFLRLQVASN